MKNRRWWIVVGLVVSVNILVAVWAAINGGYLWGGSGEVALSAGLRADLVGVERPWLNNTAQEKPAMLRLDLEKGREQLASALKKGEAKVEKEVPPELFCKEWGPFLPDQIQRVRDSLVDWTGQIEQQQKQETIGYIVFLPRSLVEAGADVAALGQLGLTDVFYMAAPGPLQGGISLGIFRDQERALQHVQEMESRGVVGAELRPRLGTERTFFKLIGVQAEMDKLDEIYSLNRRSTLSQCEEAES